MLPPDVLVSDPARGPLSVAQLRNDGISRANTSKGRRVSARSARCPGSGWGPGRAAAMVPPDWPGPRPCRAPVSGPGRRCPVRPGCLDARSGALRRRARPACGSRVLVLAEAVVVPPAHARPRRVKSLQAVDIADPGARRTASQEETVPAVAALPVALLGSDPGCPALRARHTGKYLSHPRMLTRAVTAGSGGSHPNMVAALDASLTNPEPTSSPRPATTRSGTGDPTAQSGSYQQFPGPGRSPVPAARYRQYPAGHNAGDLPDHNA